MKHADRADEQRIAQVVVEINRDLAGREHSLVDQGAARQAREVKIFVIVEAGFRDLGFKPLANHVELAFEGVGVSHTRSPPDQGVEQAGLDGPCAGPQRRVVGERARHPRKTWPSSVTIFSKISIPKVCWAGSGEVKNAPTP